MNSITRILTQRSLAKFAKVVKPDYELTAFHRLMIDRLEALAEGRIRRLAFICPPRSGKTEIGNRIFPAYLLGKNPLEKIISVTYGSELSEQNGRATRGYITSPAFRDVFPHCKLSADSTASWHFETVQGGELTACGRGGPVTGRGSSCTIVDDILANSQEASSDAIKKSVIEWLKTTLFTRSTPDGRILCIGTRWAMDDPINFILSLGGFEVLHLPAFCDSKNDALGRAIGEPLWPSVWTTQALEEKRIEIGPRAFQTEYQGNPTGAEGAVFKRSWIRNYKEVPAKFSKTIQSWDCAYRVGQENDFSVCTTWGSTASGYFLLDCYREKLEFPDLLKKVKVLAEVWNPDEILIEQAGSGISAVQELQNSTSIPVIAIKPDKSKIERANACSGYFESGRIWFPESAPWRDTVLDELCGFPAAAHDDVVDSVTMAIHRLRDRGDDLSLVNWVRDRGMAWLAGADKPRAKLPVGPPAPVSASLICCPGRYRQQVPGGERCGNCGAPWVPVMNLNAGPCDCDPRLHVGLSGTKKCNQCGRQWFENGGPRPVIRFNRKNLPVA